MTIDEFSKHLIERSVSSLSEKYGEKCPKCGKSPCECEKEEVKEAKNKEGKEQGADGKACWKGYKYAGTENGKDKCVKSEEWEGSKEDKGEDKKLAKKNKMSLSAWEKSAADKKHDMKKEEVEKAEKEEKGEKKHKEGEAEEKKEMKKEAKDYLPGNQEKLDANKNGKLDSHDFAMLRNRKAKKSVKEMWEKAAAVAEGKKVEIEIMPQVDTPNDPEPVTGKKAKKEVKKEEYDVETANQLWLEVGERLEKLGEMDDVDFRVLGEKKLSKAETAKKEKFVKGMKKKFGSFKSKYGERAKDVMYGTATAMAKKAAK